MALQTSDHRGRLLSFQFFFSGIPALIYQVAWQRQLTLSSGVGSFSVSTIIAAFMAGIGLGSALGGDLSRRLSHRQSLLVFGLVELSIGLCGWLSASRGLVISFLPAGWYAGDKWQMVIAHVVTLLIPTTLMGMTFPLLAQALLRHGKRSSEVIGTLYALNVAGSAAGSLLAGFVLIPNQGISGAIFFASVINGCVALVSMLGAAIGGNFLSEIPPSEADTKQSEMSPAPAVPLSFWYLAYTLSGFISIGLEIVWFRMVDIGTKSTSYTFSLILGIYLGGMAAGTVAGNRLVRKMRRPLDLFLLSQAGVICFSLVPVLLLVYLPRILPFADRLISYWQTYEPISIVNQSTGQMLIFYFYFPMVLFLVPTFLMGLSFVALQDGIQCSRERASFRLGLLQASNIAGCMVASLFTGLIGLNLFKTQGMLQLFFAAGLVIFGGSFLVRGYRLISIFLAAVVIGCLLGVPENRMIWERFHGQSDSRRLDVIESETGVISLIDEGGRVRVSNNGKGQSYIPYGGVHSKLGAIPAVIHGQPARMAIIGLGSGDTAWAAGSLSETLKIDVFEICSDQWQLLSRLAQKNNDRMLASLISDTRFKIIPEDGRIGIASDPEGYDMIEADAIRPNGAYAGNLYSVEFYSLCRAKLRPGGIMCTWAPTARTALTFRSVFPHVVELDGGQILIGSNEPIPLDQERWSRLLKRTDTTAYLGPQISRECLDGLVSARILPPLSDREKVIQTNTDNHPLDEFEIPQPGK